MSALLTKIRYLNGLHCPKRLWLEAHQPEQAAPMSFARQYQIEQGIEVGAAARERFPEGVLIGGQHPQEALAQTQEAVAQDVTCLFEPAFECEGMFVRCDILRRNAGATWDLIEVKSGTRVKADYLEDAAIQTYVLRGAGVPLRQTRLMYINRACVAPDLSDLFAIDDVTGEIEALLPAIPARLALFQAILDQEIAPEVVISKICQTVTCPLRPVCWRDVPIHSIFTIPRLPSQKANDLAAQGCLSVTELPSDFPLTGKQRAYVDAVLRRQPRIDIQGIRTALTPLSFPIHFLDFETLSPAIPRFEGMSPYDPFPFQYSCHVLEEDGTLRHGEYLHTVTTDPRPHLVSSLLLHIGASGSVVAYNATFERMVLQRLAAEFPDCAAPLQAMIARLWDQLGIFRKYYLHPDFLGSNSIKRVLPVIVPSLSYQELGVQKGDEAQAIWDQMIHTSDEQKKQQMIQDLSDYCKLDTLAMVEIHKVLLTL